MAIALIRIGPTNTFHAAQTTKLIRATINRCLVLYSEGVYVSSLITRTCIAHLGSLTPLLRAFLTPDITHT